jgi:hypothetical protein
VFKLFQNIKLLPEFGTAWCRRRPASFRRRKERATAQKREAIMLAGTSEVKFKLFIMCITESPKAGYPLRESTPASGGSKTYFDWTNFCRDSQSLLKKSVCMAQTFSAAINPFVHEV